MLPYQVSSSSMKILSEFGFFMGVIPTYNAEFSKLFPKWYKNPVKEGKICEFQRGMIRYPKSYL